MRRLLAVTVGLGGILVVPLCLSGATSWLGVAAHFGLAVALVALVVGDVLAGRAGSARAWGAWFVVVTGGAAWALHAGSWARDGWGWMIPFVLMASWSWIPPVTAWGASRVAERRRRQLARHAVRVRQLALSKSEG